MVEPARDVAGRDRPDQCVRGFPLIGRTRVVGVLNVTPDSFSDGGVFLDTEVAVAHGCAMIAAGADLVDVGGESTRPGAGRVSAEVEAARVLPVIAALAARKVPVSVDTTRAEIAAAALDAGALLVNDVSGGFADADMYALVAARGVPYVLMHSRGASLDMASAAQYDDVVREVHDELAVRLAAARRAGIDPAQIVLDPGLGFHKVGDQNWALLAHLAALKELGRPLLVGASRKTFLGRTLPSPDGAPRPADRRDAATHATTALAAAAGAWAVRVHDVAASADAVRVAAAWSLAAGR